MKHQNLHIIFNFISIWRFFYESNILFDKPESLNKKNYLLFILLFVFTFSFSQQFTNYTTKDGLPSNHIYKVIQEAKGFIWIGTDKGLVKYNGNTFKTFTTKNGLASNDVWGLRATPDGKLWYLSKAAKLGYVENDSVYAFESETKGEIFNSLFTLQVNNQIILSSSQKSHKLEKGKWTTVLDNSSRTKIFYNYIEHKNISKFKTSYNRDTLSFINKNEKVVKRLHIQDFLIKSHVKGQLTDSLYFFTSATGYKIFNLNTLKLTERTFKKEIGIENLKYTKIILVNNQLQLSGSGYVGVLDKNFNLINGYKFPDNINAHLALIDNNKNIWLCTFNNGLYKLPKVKKAVKYAFTNQKINHITQVNDKIIVSIFNKGFFKYNPLTKEFSPFLKKESFLYKPNYLKELNTEYYITEKNLTAINNGVKKPIKLKINFKNQVGDIEVDRQFVYFNRSIYGIYSAGINKINPKTYTITNEYAQYGTNHLSVFNDKLLIATTNGLKQLKHGEIEDVKFKNIPLNHSILNMHKVSKTDVLLNTDGFGAYISDLKTIKQLPGSEFLIVNDAFVKNNNIWLATNKGILEYIKTNDNYSLQKQIDMSNGLPSNNINDVFVVDDQVLVGTNSGVAIVPKDQEDNSQLLDIYFENSTYNNKNITATNAVFNYKANNSFKVEVSSLDFSEDYSNFSYNYKLEPLQNQWLNTTVKTINYNDLQPGKYSLHIQNDTIEKQLDFEIKPLWWQTFWAKLALSMLLVTCLILIVWRIIKSIQDKKNEKFIQEKKLSEIQLKALRSQMNPHFVFNSLAAIQYYINNNQMEASEAYLVKFSKLIRQFFELSKETEISLEQEIKLITNYLDIEKLRFKDKFDYTINVDEKLNKKTSTLPTMLLQPIVENAINHGIFNKIENGNVSINFIFINNKSFKVEIIDDGVGFINTTKQGEKAIKSSHVLKDRLKYLNTSEKWYISYSEEALHPNLEDKGNSSTFIIKQL